jgi:hypothetical protein
MQEDINKAISTMNQALQTEDDYLDLGRLMVVVASDGVSSSARH